MWKREFPFLQTEYRQYLCNVSELRIVANISDGTQDVNL